MKREKPRRISIDGVPIDVVSDEEAEKANFMVCILAPEGEPLKFADNFTGFCCRCGAKVQYRWYAPRKPKRICLGCAMANVHDLASASVFPKC